MIGGQPREVTDVMQKYLDRIKRFPFYKDFFKCNIDTMFNIHNANMSWGCFVRDEK